VKPVRPKGLESTRARRLEPTRSARLKSALSVLVAVLILAGCGGDSAEPAKQPEEAPIPGNIDIDVSLEAQHVQVGMSETEVIGILGKPRARVGDSRGQRLTFWNFDQKQQIRSRVYVTLDKEGKVIDVETI
jgi:hypothetical protein